MFNLQGSEIIVILLLALVVLGPEKLPDAIRKFAQTYGELKKMGTGFQSELKSALDEPVREMKETARLVQDAADPQKIADQAADDSALREAAEAADRAAITDVPIAAAALEAADPAYGVAEPQADTADEGGTDHAGAFDSLAANGSAGDAWGAPSPDAAVEHAAPVVVNQIAAANARRPIEPVPAPESVPAPMPENDASVADVQRPIDADAAAR